jgi:hypothetical protein
MKHKFRINRGVSVEDALYKEVDIEIGKRYLCIQTYLGFSDQRANGQDSIFTEGNYYKLIDYSEGEAWFIANGGIQFFIRSFMEGALFEYFDFSKHQIGVMNFNEWKN